MLTIAWIVLAGFPAAWGGDSRDGTIVKSEPCQMAPLTHAQDLEAFRKDYESESAIARGRGLTPLPFEQLPGPTEAEWAAMRGHDGFECRQIRYLSDGLEINGFLYKPVDTAGKRLPVVIMN